MAKLGYQNSETPEPIVTKVGMGDYIGDVTPQSHMPKLKSIALVGASPQMGEISFSHVFSFLSFFNQFLLASRD